MKKFNYLLSLFFLLEGSMFKRFKIITEINEAIKQRMSAGNTLDEAIDSVGHVHEIVQEYTGIWSLNKNTSKYYSLFYILTGIIITIFIISDFIVIITRTITIEVMTSGNSSIFMASKTNITLVLIKIIIELILLLFIAKKIIKHYICHKTK